MRKLIEMKSKMYNTPHLIDAETFGWVEGIVNAQSEKPQMALDKDKKKKRELDYNPDTKVGLIAVHGPLTYEEYEAVCGEANASYQGIQAQLEALIDAGAKTIVLDVDGPGGEAYAMMETGQYMRDLADAHGVNLIAYVDGLSASATYGLTASAHEVVVNPMAELGSIGVVVKLRNVNKAMREMGVEDTYIHAGKDKIPFNAEGEFTKEFLEDIQEKVDALYEEFTSYVATLRGISVDAVKATEAKTFLAPKAVELGLADKIMTRESFFEYLADVVQSGDTMLKNKLFGKKEEMSMTAEEKAMLENLQGSVAELTTALDEKTVQLTAAIGAVAEKNAALEAATAALAEANAKLHAIDEAEKAAKAAAEAARLEARKTALVEAVGEAEAETLFESLSTLPDTAFEAVVGKMKASAEKREQDNPLFKELGHDADKGVETPDASALKTMLAEKYGRPA